MAFAGRRALRRSWVVNTRPTNTLRVSKTLRVFQSPGRDWSYFFNRMGRMGRAT